MVLCRLLTAAGLLLHLFFGCCFGEHAHVHTAAVTEHAACCHSHAAHDHSQDGSEQPANIPGHCPDQSCVFAAVVVAPFAPDLQLPPAAFLADELCNLNSAVVFFDSEVAAQRGSPLRRHLALGVLLI